VAAFEGGLPKPTTERGHKTDTSGTTRATSRDASAAPGSVRFAGKTVPPIHDLGPRCRCPGARARATRRNAHVVLSRNYGEASALELFAHHLPPVASGDVTFRYWRPHVTGHWVVLVGFTRTEAGFCHGYQIVGRIAMPVANDERGQPLARCQLNRRLTHVWPQILRES
jgi:hypothetical protein